MKTQSASAVGARHYVPDTEGNLRGAGGAQADRENGRNFVHVTAINDEAYVHIADRGTAAAVIFVVPGIVSVDAMVAGLIDPTGAELGRGRRLQIHTNADAKYGCRAVESWESGTRTRRSSSAWARRRILVQAPSAREGITPTARSPSRTRGSLVSDTR